MSEAAESVTFDIPINIDAITGGDPGGTISLAYRFPGDSTWTDASSDDIEIDDTAESPTLGMLIWTADLTSYTGDGGIVYIRVTYSLGAIEEQVGLSKAMLVEDSGAYSYELPASGLVAVPVRTRAVEQINEKLDLVLDVLEDVLEALEAEETTAEDATT